MADKPEFVWVVDRMDMFIRGCAPYGFFSDEIDVFGRPFHNMLESAFFVERAYAETHSNLKQIIPYTIVSTRVGAAVTLDEVTYPTFVYQRTPKGGEGRLHHKFSIGVGGHINPEDAVSYPEESVLFTFVKGAQREVSEELMVLLDSDRKDFETLQSQLCEPIGFINDDTTPVGSVHLGVVCSIIVDEASIREVDQLVGEFVFPHRLLKYPDTAVRSKGTFGYEPGEYETWSQFLVDRNEETKWLT